MKININYFLLLIIVLFTFQATFAESRQFSEIAHDINLKFNITQDSFRYSGYYWDPETNNNYLNARYYSPELMSFISRDTYDLANRYAYCGGDPLSNTDPAGHTPFGSLVEGAINSVTGSEEDIFHFSLGTSTIDETIEGAALILAPEAAATEEAAAAAIEGEATATVLEAAATEGDAAYAEGETTSIKAKSMTEKSPLEPQRLPDRYRPVSLPATDYREKTFSENLAKKYGQYTSDQIEHELKENLAQYMPLDKNAIEIRDSEPVYKYKSCIFVKCKNSITAESYCENINIKNNFCSAVQSGEQNDWLIFNQPNGLNDNRWDVEEFLRTEETGEEEYKGKETIDYLKKLERTKDFANAFMLIY